MIYLCDDCMQQLIVRFSSWGKLFPLSLFFFSRFSSLHTCAHAEDFASDAGIDFETSMHPTLSSRLSIFSEAVVVFFSKHVGENSSRRTLSLSISKTIESTFLFLPVSYCTRHSFTVFCNSTRILDCRCRIFFEPETFPLFNRISIIRDSKAGTEH